MRFPNGATEEGPYVDGEIDGLWVTRRFDGVVELVTTWRNGKIMGSEYMPTARGDARRQGD